MNRVRDVVSDVDHATFTQADVESNDVRCPDSNAAKEMYAGMQTHTLPSSVSCRLPLLLTICPIRIVVLDLRMCVSVQCSD